MHNTAQTAHNRLGRSVKPVSADRPNTIDFGTVCYYPHLMRRRWYCVLVRYIAFRQGCRAAAAAADANRKQPDAAEKRTACCKRSRQFVLKSMPNSVSSKAEFAMNRPIQVAITYRVGRISLNDVFPQFLHGGQRSPFTHVISLPQFLHL